MPVASLVSAPTGEAGRSTPGMTEQRPLSIPAAAAAAPARRGEADRGVAEAASAFVPFAGDRRQHGRRIAGRDGFHLPPPSPPGLNTRCTGGPRPIPAPSLRRTAGVIVGDVEAAQQGFPRGARVLGPARRQQCSSGCSAAGPSGTSARNRLAQPVGAQRQHEPQPGRVGGAQPGQVAQPGVGDADHPEARRGGPAHPLGHRGQRLQRQAEPSSRSLAGNWKSMRITTPGINGSFCYIAPNQNTSGYWRSGI